MNGFDDVKSKTILKILLLVIAALFLLNAFLLFRLEDPRLWEIIDALRTGWIAQGLFIVFVLGTWYRRVRKNEKKSEYTDYSSKKGDGFLKIGDAVSIFINIIKWTLLLIAITILILIIVNMPF